MVDNEGEGGREAKVRKEEKKGEMNMEDVAGVCWGDERGEKGDDAGEEDNIEEEEEKKEKDNRTKRRRKKRVIIRKRRVKD